MGKWSWKRIAIISVVIATIAIIILLAAAIKDWAGYSAKDSMVLEPKGDYVGNALVVYNPGLSGKVKQAAMFMAEQLSIDGQSLDRHRVS